MQEVKGKDISKITAIVVSYNPDLSVFPEVLSRILTQVDNLVLVDNGSSNCQELKKALNSYEHNIDVLFLEENLGLASAQNIAIKRVLNKTDYIILFDQDSLIEECLISNLTAAHCAINDYGMKVAAVGPTFYDPGTGSFYPATIYFGPFIKRVKLEDKPVEATFIIASGCLINVEALNIIGLMNEGYFIDYIDVEWCLRAKSHGYGVYMIPTAKMQHTIGDARISIMGRTLSVHSPLRRYYLIRNSFLIVRLRHIPVGYKIREMSFNFLRAIIAIATNKDKRSTLRYIYRGVFDGLRGKTGRFAG